MSKYFTPSINIIRDQERDFEYILTSNGQRVFELLADNFRAGNRAFSLLGSYGTGKSSFLLALEQHLAGNKKHFGEQFDGDRTFEFVKIVGGYESFIKRFSQELSSSDESKNEKAILKLLQSRVSEKHTTVILLDEFGKFLEYAGKHEPEKELYFLQLLAEFVADPQNNALLMLTLHQGFQSYSLGLSQKERNEYEKVKGRLLEIGFQEPVEQLLYIAAQYLPEIQQSNAAVQEVNQKAASIAVEKQIFDFTESDVAHLTERLYPMDLLAASVLARALNRYGQNERSLFTFLESETSLSLRAFEPKEENPFYTIPLVFDYLMLHYFSSIFSPNNPDYFKWQLIQESLDRVSSRVSEDLLSTAEGIIKIVGILKLLGKTACKVDRDFLSFYVESICGLPDAQEALEKLQSIGVLRFQSHTGSFVLFEGSDFNFEEEQANIRRNLSESISLMPTLIELFSFPILIAKKHLFETGTPRYFQVLLTDTPISSFENISDEIDGVVNLVLTGNASLSVPKENDRILYSIYQDEGDILSLAREYIIANELKIKAKISEEKVAIREVDSLIESLSVALNDAILGPIQSDPSKAQWMLTGQSLSIDSIKSFQQSLSDICDQVFSEAPKIKNELVNKHYLSASINTARKKLIEAMASSESEELLGFSERLFPAEKTIYLSILKDNFHVQKKDVWELIDRPLAPSFQPFWRTGEEFLRSAQDQARSVRDLIDIWRRPPFGLRKGMSDVFLQLFLYLKRNDFSFYNDQGHLVADITPQTLELVYRKPEKYTLKSFEIAGTRLNIFNQYRELTMLTPQARSTQQGFIETVKPFLVFYKQLSEYAKQTSNISSDAIAFRRAILKAKDPAKTFFEDFPAAFGYTLDVLEQNEEVMKAFSERIKDSIRELREADQRLSERIIAAIIHYLGVQPEIEFNSLQALIRSKYKEVQEHYLRPDFLTLLRRINVEIDDQQAWISSIVQSVIHKRLESISDAEEAIVIQKLTDGLRALDNYRDVTNLDSIQENEEILQVELTSLKNGFEKVTLSRISRAEEEALSQLKEQLKAVLSKNENINTAALAELLKERLSTHDR